ncbi:MULTISPECIES: hypothetical protein [Paracoccus]|uniref:hypothetical protein n=1 Tax=Paracoccus TaxID=265 RepID=UPI000E247103|nr:MULTISPECIES: hypothetical protein [Paracoccus]WGR55569.1 hypothetical protein E3U25_06175 [Paracoccus versutus]
MCAIILRAIKQALTECASVLQISHFAEAYRLRYDCVPALNPFLSDNYLAVSAPRSVPSQTPAKKRRRGL